MSATWFLKSFKRLNLAILNVWQIAKLSQYALSCANNIRTFLFSLFCSTPTETIRSMRCNQSETVHILNSCVSVWIANCGRMMTVSILHLMKIIIIIILAGLFSVIVYSVAFFHLFSHNFSVQLCGSYHFFFVLVGDEFNHPVWCTILVQFMSYRCVRGVNGWFLESTCFFSLCLRFEVWFLQQKQG